MAEWRTSSHCSRWMFSAAELATMRVKNNQRAVDAIQKHGHSRVEAVLNPALVEPRGQSDAATSADGHTTAAAAGGGRGADGEGVIGGAQAEAGGDRGGGGSGGNGGSGDNGEAPRPKALSEEEERVMCRYYEGKIQEVCSAFRFPYKIYSTSLQYFKRFFLVCSVMEHDPKGIMLTAIYIACKVDEVYVSAEEFGRGIGQDPQLVLDNEVTVLQTLKFDLICYGPYRAIDGFMLQLDKVSPHTMHMVSEGCVASMILSQGIWQDPPLVLDHEVTVLQTLKFDLICYGPYRAIDGFMLQLDKVSPHTMHMVSEGCVASMILSQGIWQDPPLVLDHEVTVLQTLKFDLICYGPYRAIDGFMLQLDKVSPHTMHMLLGEPLASQPEEAKKQAAQTLTHGANAAVSSIFLTDAPLLFPPSQLALAAIKLANNASCAIPSFQSLLESIVAAAPRGAAGAAANGHASSGHPHTAAGLLAAVKSIEHMVKSSGPLPAADVVKRIDRKLKYCRNPSLMLQDRKERKERSKSKRASHSVALTAAPAIASSPLEDAAIRNAKRRRSTSTLPQGT
ncbi:hypothetical protein CLOP_g4030 [Closterium sp. NIES-67]|nr:hypothetical protein CLOP_g4030 [Closterium sp. NIES-67]